MFYKPSVDNGADGSEELVVSARKTCDASVFSSMRVQIHGNDQSLIVGAYNRVPNLGLVNWETHKLQFRIQRAIQIPPFVTTRTFSKIDLAHLPVNLDCPWRDGMVNRRMASD